MKNDFDRLLTSIATFKIPKYTDSKALLYWFLFNIFRLDEIEARDSICDDTNDKGIDGLWVDEDSNEIFVFQSKFTAKPSNTLGDKDFREFIGTAQWLSDPINVLKLLASNANPDLKALLNRLQIATKLAKGYTLQLVFVSTRQVDQNGAEYLATLEGKDPHLDAWDQFRLISHHKNLERSTRVLGKFSFVRLDQGIGETLDGIKTLMTYVRASDIASMSGIDDRSLFALNVRLGLGRTRVNKDLDKAIRVKLQHHFFRVFHNGVTIICQKLTSAKDMVEIENYSIVNGCQSAIAFRENQKELTKDLSILARFIEVGGDDDLAEDITYRTNNQNGISLRDLKSNDRIQVALKNEVQKVFDGRVQYQIKPGEKPIAGIVLQNDRVAQLVMSLYLDEPYNAHQKYRLFGTDYERVFGRETNAWKIYLSYVINNAVAVAIGKLDDPLIQEYQLTRFIVLGLVGNILRKDPMGKTLLDEPEALLTKDEKAVTDALEILAAHVVADFNFFIKEAQAKGYYDYKSEFKSPDKYRSILREIERSYQRNLVRHPEDSFENLAKAKISSTTS
jgi:AIPR protein